MNGMSIFVHGFDRSIAPLLTTIPSVHMCVLMFGLAFMLTLPLVVLFPRTLSPVSCGTGIAIDVYRCCLLYCVGGLFVNLRVYSTVFPTLFNLLL